MKKKSGVLPTVKVTRAVHASKRASPERHKLVWCTA